MTTPTKTRKRATRRHPERARELILKAAAEVFAYKGFHRTAVEDVARASGYAPASVYKYFHGKEELLFGIWQLVSHHLASLLDEVEAMPATFEVRVRWFSVKYARFVEEEKAIMGCFMSMYPTASRTEMTQAEVEAIELYHEQQRRLSTLMQQGIKEGALEPGDPQDYVVALLSLLRGCAFSWANDESHTPLSARLSMSVDLFLRGSARTHGED
jgi:AcrR family transcriptional regulator